jgi:uncharacterized membrane protein
VILRAWGIYGEPSPWTTQATPLLTALSFINCTKQPPSLLFVLMTLGPAIAALAAIDRADIRGHGIRGLGGRALVTFGRVPLFYFLLQWYVIHGLAALTGLVRGFIAIEPAVSGCPSHRSVRAMLSHTALTLDRDD